MIEPSIGTPSAPWTTKRSDRPAATRMTRPLAHIFATAISLARTGMTSRCSIVPCSRSRMTAAPTSRIDRIVMFSITDMTEWNQAPSRFGLKKARLTVFTGTAEASPRAWRKSAGFPLNDGVDVSGADPSLGHGRRIDVKLEFGLTSAQGVGFEPGWDVEHESPLAIVHHKVQFGPVDDRRGPEIRAQERFAQARRQGGAVAIDHGDACVLDLGLHTGRHAVDRE